jgi:hypothetical protein
VLRNDLLHHLVNFSSWRVTATSSAPTWCGCGTFSRRSIEQVYNPRLDELRDRLASEQAEDFARWGRYPTNVPGFPDDMASNIEVIKSQIACHRDFLRRFIETFHPEIPTQPRVKITEIMYWPENGEDDLEFIEFLSTSGRDQYLRRRWRE